MLPCLLISQDPYIARLLCYIVAESLNGKTPQSNKQKKGFRSRHLSSEVLDFKSFSVLLSQRGPFLLVTKSVGTLRRIFQADETDPVRGASL